MQSSFKKELVPKNLTLELNFRYININKAILRFFKNAAKSKLFTNITSVKFKTSELN